MGHYDCKDCDASPHEEHRADCGRFSEVVTATHPVGSPQYRLEELREWVDQRCPEGVSGTVENAEWLLSFAEDIAASDMKKRLSDAVTLLYTHGVITEKMRAHARQNL